jgi:hypothetical protein
MNAVRVKLGNGWYSQEQQHNYKIYGKMKIFFLFYFG